MTDGFNRSIKARAEKLFMLYAFMSRGDNAVRDKKLMAIVISVLLAFAVLVVLVATIGGGLESHRLSRLRIADIDISAEAVGFSDAVLNVSVYIDNDGTGSSGDITLMIKAYDTDTNLLVVTNSTQVGVIRAKETKVVSAPVRVPKRGNYRLRIVVFEDGKRQLQGERVIYGLTSLEPPSAARISIRGIDFLVQAVEEGVPVGKQHVVINTTLYIDNLGPDVSGLRTLIKARDRETELITAREWIDLGLLKSGTTSLHYANLRVLNGRDYLVEVQVWQSGRIIKEGSGMVLLGAFSNKTMRIGVKEKMVEVAPGTNISEFVRTRPAAVRAPVPYPSSGFGSLTMCLALVFGLIILLRKRR